MRTRPPVKRGANNIVDVRGCVRAFQEEGAFVDALQLDEVVGRGVQRVRAADGEGQQLQGLFQTGAVRMQKQPPTQPDLA